MTSQVHERPLFILTQIHTHRQGFNVHPYSHTLLTHRQGFNFHPYSHTLYDIRRHARALTHTFRKGCEDFWLESDLYVVRVCMCSLVRLLNCNNVEDRGGELWTDKLNKEYRIPKNTAHLRINLRNTAPLPSFGVTKASPSRMYTDSALS